jgi:hypothetical protein
LEEVIFQGDNALRVIENEAFAMTGCKMFTVPDSVEEIRDRCFAGCRDLSTVSFHKGSKLEHIGKKAFSKTNISSLQLPSRLLNVPTSMLFKCPIEKIVIPPSVDSLDDRCFYKWTWLKEIVFADGSRVSYMGSEALGHTKIRKCQVSRTIEILGDRCFAGQSAPCEVVFEGGIQVKELPFECFAGSLIERISIPASVETIGMRCFCGCDRLSSVTFESAARVKSFDTLAFARTAVVTIHIPRSVEVIGLDCFRGCKQLQEIVFAKDCELKLIE